jgi:hypothetical protein
MALTGYLLVGSLYLTFPGEPGFDPQVAERAAFFGRVVTVLGFPVLPILMHFPASPLVDGLRAWFWFALNSLLWGTILVAAWLALTRRLVRGGQDDPRAS